RRSKGTGDRRARQAYSPRIVAKLGNTAAWQRVVPGSHEPRRKADEKPKRNAHRHREEEPSQDARLVRIDLDQAFVSRSRHKPSRPYGRPLCDPLVRVG